MINNKLFSQSDTHLKKVDDYITKYKIELSAAPKKALKTAEEFLEYVETKKDSSNTIRALNCIAAYHMSLGQFGQAKKAYLQIIKLLDANVKIPALNLGRIYNDMGALYMNLHDNKMAFESLLIAYKIRDSIQDPKIGSTLNNISSLYNLMGELNTSLQFLQKAFKYKKKNKDGLGMANILNNIAIIYLKQEKYDLAIKTSLKSIKHVPLNASRIIVGMAYANIGVAYFKLGDYPNAIAYYNKQLSLGKTQLAKNIIANSYMLLGDCYLNTGQYQLSETYLFKGLKLSREIGYVFLEEDSYFLLATLYEKMQDFKTALKYNDIYYAFSDSLNNAAIKQKTASLKSNFEALIAKQEKELLEKENKLKDIELEKFQVQRRLWSISAILMLIITGLSIFLYLYRTKTNQKLIALNATKDKLFALVAHDLKNPLSAFRSITQSLTDNFDTIEKNDISFFLTKLNKSSDKLFNLLQNLLEWALNETGKIPYKAQKLDLSIISTEVKELLSLNAEEKKIVLSNEIPQNSFVMADKRMLKTILRNLISNAIKFSPQNSTISVHCSQNEKGLTVHVTDKGLGISKSDQKRLFLIHEEVSTIGDSKEKGTGLGLILCKELVMRHNGSIWVESKTGVGSTFSFSLPKNALT